MTIARGCREGAGLRAKRAVDVIGALAVLVVTSPVLAVAALVVRVDLGRPVLFRQRRPGLGGHCFELVKFRTMRQGGGADADRLTRAGRMLRATSIDELPELWNVLRGDMSLVGPRPLLPEYLDRYDQRQARRHEVRPGLTGLAQVSGRNALGWGERLELDVRYVESRSMRLDVRILLTTVGALVNARGISADGHATMPAFDPRADAQVDPDADVDAMAPPAEAAAVAASPIGAGEPGDRHIRVAWVTKGMGRGGAEAITVDLTPALAAHGVSVTVLSVSAAADRDGDLRAGGIEVRRPPSYSRWPLWLACELRRSRPDVIHVQNPLPAVVIGLLRRLGVFGSAQPPRLVVTEHNQPGMYHWATRRANAATLWARDATIAVCAAARPPRVRREAHVIHHGAAMPALVSRAEARRVLGLDDVGPVVAQVAGFRRQKDHETFVRAAAMVLAERPGTRFVLVGDGPTRRGIEALASQLGVAGAVRFVGSLPDAARYLQAFDVVTLFSHGEGFPISLVEALHARRVIVASDVGGVAEALRTSAGELAGRLVPPGDPVAAARGILLALGGGVGVGTGSFRNVTALRSAELSVEVTAGAYVALYRRLLAPARPAAQRR